MEVGRWQEEIDHWWLADAAMSDRHWLIANPALVIYHLSEFPHCVTRGRIWLTNLEIVCTFKIWKLFHSSCLILEVFHYRE